MARTVMADVKAPGIKPKSSKDKTMGIPVKSNYIIGNYMEFYFEK
jgi:hypothetical protein